MINIKVFKKDSVYTGFEVSGHAGYAEYGHDIVCAAVSMLVLNTINSIETFTGDHFSAEAEEESGYIKFQLEDTISNDSKLLLNSLVLGLQGVAEEYNKEYINLEVKEV
ncbi:MAG: ribosomal-processing cysteine protease Prp [bacterium]|nr:ribosomal-processing cysteine protease Prp [bacterium]